MFDIKIVLTLIVTLFLIAGFLGTNETVSGFFDSIGSRIPFTTSARDIDFTLTADNYSDMAFTAKGINLTVDGDTRATLKTGNLQTNSTLSIYGFQGSGSIAGTTLELDGRISKVELPEIAVAVQETIKSTSAFTGLTVANLGLKTIRIHATGSLVVRNTTAQFSGDIDISDPLGNFEINRNGRVFYINGKASRIAIPGSNIVID